MNEAEKMELARLERLRVPAQERFALANDQWAAALKCGKDTTAARAASEARQAELSAILADMAAVRDGSWAGMTPAEHSEKARSERNVKALQEEIAVLDSRLNGLADVASSRAGLTLRQETNRLDYQRRRNDAAAKLNEKRRRIVALRKGKVRA